MSSMLAAIGRQTTIPEGRWTVDPRHSTVEFEIRQLTITKVRGRFREFEGALEGDGLAGVRAHRSIRVESLDTGAPERDAHLLSPDFFDADRHPHIRYALLAFRAEANGRVRALGELTIRGVTRQTALDATVSDTVRDPWGNDRFAIELQGELSRRGFGLRWNGLLDGQPIVGDAVRVAVRLSLMRPAAPLPPLGGRIGSSGAPTAA